MSSGFAALMALSASQTKASQSAVQTALEQRQRNEELQRKKRDELERKIREEEAKLRQKRFEDDKKHREDEARREAERGRLEAEQARREEQARHALLHGPKKALARWPASHSGIKEDVRRRRTVEEEEEPGMALTREEKRQRRVEMEMRRTYQTKRISSGYTKAGRRLPGGAIDTQTLASEGGGAGTRSVKARIAAQPNTLTKLNVNKRDTRTIDEILQDRAKAKNATLDGEEAREFNDWFGKGKKKEGTSAPSNPSSASLASASAPSSGANSPRPASSKTTAPPPQTKQPSFVNGRASGSSGPKSGPSRPALSAKSSSSTIPKLPKSSRSKSPVQRPPHPSKPSASNAPPRSTAPKKRPRSPTSRSVSPPPLKRRASESEHTLLSSQIWKLFGKDRSSYVARDVLSDDEDMEADASVLMKEEMRSARLARREDELALEEEKRHEDEKRRRKREREMRERQGM